MIRIALAMFCSLFSDKKAAEEIPLDPLVAKLKFPARMPTALSYEEKCEAVVSLMRNKFAGKVSARIVDRVSNYYGVNLNGKGIFVRDPRNRKVLVLVG